MNGDKIHKLKVQLASKRNSLAKSQKNATLPAKEQLKHFSAERIVGALTYNQVESVLAIAKENLIKEIEEIQKQLPGPKPRDPVHDPAVRRIDAFVRYYTTGETMKAIAADYGVGGGCISNDLMKVERMLRHPARRRGETEDAEFFKPAYDAIRSLPDGHSLKRSFFPTAEQLAEDEADRKEAIERRKKWQEEQEASQKLWLGRKELAAKMLTVSNYNWVASYTGMTFSYKMVAHSRDPNIAAWAKACKEQTP